MMKIKVTRDNIQDTGMMNTAPFVKDPTLITVSTIKSKHLEQIPIIEKFDISCDIDVVVGSVSKRAFLLIVDEKGFLRQIRSMSYVEQLMDYEGFGEKIKTSDDWQGYAKKVMDEYPEILEV